MFVLLDGLLGAPESVQRQAEIRQGFGVLGPQPQRHAAASCGALELAEHPIRFSEVGVKSRNTRLQADCLADQLDGPSMVALLMAQHAEQVQRIGVVFFTGQQLLVQASGWGKLPALVQADRRRQHVVHGW